MKVGADNEAGVLRVHSNDQWAVFAGVINRLAHVLWAVDAFEVLRHTCRRRQFDYLAITFDNGGFVLKCLEYERVGGVRRVNSCPMY